MVRNSQNKRCTCLQDAFFYFGGRACGSNDFACFKAAIGFENRHVSSCDCDRCPLSDEGSRLVVVATQKISGKQRLAKIFLMLQRRVDETEFTKNTKS